MASGDTSTSSAARIEKHLPLLYSNEFGLPSTMWPLFLSLEKNTVCAAKAHFPQDEQNQYITKILEKSSCAESIEYMKAILTEEKPDYISELTHIFALFQDDPMLYYYLIFFFLYVKKDNPKTIVLEHDIILYSTAEKHMYQEFFANLYHMMFINNILFKLNPEYGVLYYTTDFTHLPYSGDGPDSCIMLLTEKLLSSEIGIAEKTKIINAIVIFIKNPTYKHYVKFLIDYYVNELIKALDTDYHVEFIHFREIYLFLNLIYLLGEHGIQFCQIRKLFFNHETCVEVEFEDDLAYVKNSMLKSYVYDSLYHVSGMIYYYSKDSIEENEEQMNETFAEMKIDLSMKLIFGITIYDIDDTFDIDMYDTDYAHIDSIINDKNLYPRFLEILEKLHEMYS